MIQRSEEASRPDAIQSLLTTGLINDYLSLYSFGFGLCGLDSKDNVVMGTNIQMQYELKMKEMESLIQVLKEQIAYKDNQIKDLMKSYGDVLLERDHYKKALEAL
jgi:hypothetical protein